MTPGSEFRSAFGALLGALPFVALLFLYKLGMLVHSQVGTVRVLGVFLVIAGVLAGVAAVGAALAALAPGLRARLAASRRLRLGFLSGAVISVAALGLTIFYLSPLLAPRTVLFGALAAVSVMIVAISRYPRAQLDLAAGLVLKVGQLAVLAPVLASPWVLWAYLHDTPRLQGMPEAPVGVAVSQAPERIVFVTFDALRARSTTMGGPADLTPHLAAFAREGTWYSQCRAAGGRTLVSMTAIMSGLSPESIFPELGNRLGFIREGSVTGLAGLLAPAGYQARVANAALSPQALGMLGEYASASTEAEFFNPNTFNTREFLPLGPVFEWSWQTLVERRRDFKSSGNLVRATRNAFDRATTILDSAHGRTFLWIHVMAPHAPYSYVPAGDRGKLLKPETYRTSFPFLTDSPVRLRGYERAYEQYVQFVDAEFGRFLGKLRQDPRWARTMLVMTSDHGEAFMPNQEAHGSGWPHMNITRVPLVIHLPGQASAQREDAPVSHLDLVPTVLSRVYGHVPAGYPGLPLVGASPPADRILFTWELFTRYFRDGKFGTQPYSMAAYERDFKYMWLGPEGRTSLSDWRRDPAGSRDLSATHPDVARRLDQAVRSRFKL